MIDDIPLGQHINNFYKAFAEEWATQEHNRFNITETFISPWVQAEQLTLPMQGNTLPKIYEGFVAQIGEYRIRAEEGVAPGESVLAVRERGVKRGLVHRVMRQSGRSPCGSVG